MDDKQNKELASWVLDQYKKSKSARSAFERQWYLNMAFYRGRQWVTYAPQQLGAGIGGKLVTPPAPPYRVRSVVNRVRSVVRTEVSRMTSNKPNASVVPASSEDEDLFAAQAGEQVWESIYATHKLAQIYKRAAFWTSICGNGFMKVWWDKSTVTKQRDGKTIRGDIKYAPVTPFHILVPDLTEEEIENQPWVMNVYTKPVDWVKQAYGEDFKPAVVSTTEIMNNGFLNLQAAGQNAKPDSVLVIEVWLKAGAHPQFPKGGMATIVSDRVVQVTRDGMFFDHGQFPFIKFDHIPTGGFYSASVIEDVIPIQRELNRTRSQIIEAKNRMAKPQLIAPRGSIDPSKITSEPGIVIQYRPGLAPPQPLPLQNLPPYVLDFLDRSLRDIEDVTSQHEVSKGQAPPGVTAATAISYLQERDDSIMSTTFQSIEDGWEKIAKQSLSHVVQFWEVPRIVQTTGVDGSFDSIALKGSAIKNGLDIRMEAGSALPVSKAARQALLMDMMSRGFVDPQQGLKLMEVGGVNKLYEQIAVDERQAQRENLRMRSLDVDTIMQQVAAANQSAYAASQDQWQQQISQMQNPVPQDNMPGQMPPAPGMPQVGSPDPSQTMPPPPPPQQFPMPGQPDNVDLQTGAPLVESPSVVKVNTWDNHSVHIDVHNRFRKSQAFELLPEEIKQQFEAHVQAHAAALNQSANQAQMQSGPPPGGNGGPGGGPPGGPPGSNQFGPPGSSQGNMPPPGGMPPPQ